MPKFFVTYGFGSNLGQCFSEVEAENYSAARDAIHKVTDGKFAFCYTAEEFKGQPEKYDLREVELQPQRSW